MRSLTASMQETSGFRSFTNLSFRDEEEELSKTMALKGAMELETSSAEAQNLALRQEVRDLGHATGELQEELQVAGQAEIQRFPLCFRTDSVALSPSKPTKTLV